MYKNCYSSLLLTNTIRSLLLLQNSTLEMNYFRSIPCILPINKIDAQIRSSVSIPYALCNNTIRKHINAHRQTHWTSFILISNTKLAHYLKATYLNIMSKFASKNKARYHNSNWETRCMSRGACKWILLRTEKNQWNCELLYCVPHLMNELKLIVTRCYYDSGGSTISNRRNFSVIEYYAEFV